ncbi:ABC transporter ATP-binding protein [Rhabdaerophilum calidifontis]|uniref:ABC transporter ATP-binding protein n=1 Tax=Rhabdaerophilum calidifontis TaxID=2604328 RepID=UPI0012394783|nr:oligopeptide/dipeptide ABC transporter ATP-binding protein [Rhabdaerophilum calidifontis]
MSGILVTIDALERRFDVSKPWLERVLAGERRLSLKAVDGVSFAIRRGETFALVGESGSGKSTIAKMIVGLLPPSAGRVTYAGRAPGEAPAAGGVQMIFQDPYASLNPRWRVGDIIAEPMTAIGRPADRAARRARVAELLALVGLSPRDAEKYPHQFSGGQRQRIAIARALSSEPDFIICDEPTSALDVSVQAQILNLMRDLQDRLGLTYLLISHNLAVVRHMAHQIGVLYLGRLVEVQETERLFTAPRHPYTRLLIDAVPDLAEIGRDREPLQGEVPSPIDPPPGCTFHPRCPLVVPRCRSEAPLLRDGVACHVAQSAAPT